MLRWMLIVAAALAGCEAKQEKKLALPAEAPTAETATPEKNAAAARPEAPAEKDAAAPNPPAADVAAPVITPTPADAGGSALARLTGEVTAPRRSQLAFRQQGFTELVQVKAGAVAKKGDVLATLEAKDFELRLDLARARRDQAKVGFDNADKELKRERQLAKENVSTAAALDRAQAQYDQARLALKLAEIDVVSAQRALDDTKLVAPYDCVVAEQIKDEAEWVRAGDTVFTVFDTQLPEIKLAAPERLMGRIAVGDALSIVVPSAGFAGKAHVVRMVPVISEKTRTFQVIARPDESDQRIVPGSYAEALLN